MLRDAIAEKQKNCKHTHALYVLLRELLPHGVVPAAYAQNATHVLNIATSVCQCLLYSSAFHISWDSGLLGSPMPFMQQRFSFHGTKSLAIANVVRMCDFHAIKLRCGVCGVRFHEFARDAPLVLQLLCGACSHCSNLFVVFKSINFCPFPVFHISICIVSTMSFPHVVMSFPHVVAIRVADVCFPLG